MSLSSAYFSLYLGLFSQRLEESLPTGSISCGISCLAENYILSEHILNGIADGRLMVIPVDIILLNDKMGDKDLIQIEISVDSGLPTLQSSVVHFGTYMGPILAKFRLTLRYLKE